MCNTTKVTMEKRRGEGMGGEGRERREDDP